MANWLNKYEQGGLVLKKKTKDNYGKKPNVNDVKVSAGPNFVGEGYTAYNWKSPAWGGQFAMGGALPGSVGFMYARTQNPAPANGKYTKKTLASAQKGVKKSKDVDPLVSPYAPIDASNANTIRGLFPAPLNVSQAVAKNVAGDSRLNETSLSDDQKLVLWNTIQNARKRSGVQTGGGTKYSDYGNQGYGKGKDFENWFNRGKVGAVSGIYNSLTNPGFVMASTVGRGRYWTDPNNPDDVNYTDVYDWNTHENNYKGKNAYQIVRNLVRGSEDKNLNKSKNDKNRMNVHLTKKEIDRINEMKEMKLTSLTSFDKGGVIKDDRGQWAHPGEVTEIGSNDITMQGVDYPVLGVSDTGDTKMMYPDQDYKFDGEKVTEFPMAQDGGWLDKYQDGGNINKKLKEEAEERLARMNTPKATISQYTPEPREQAKFDKQKLERIAEDNTPLNRMAASKGAANIQDAALFALDVMTLGEAAAFTKPALKAAAKYATEKTALKNAYKLNPLAFKANPEAYYRMVGKAGYADALESGVVRPPIGSGHTEAYYNKGYPLDTRLRDVTGRAGYEGPYMAEVKGNKELFVDENVAGYTGPMFEDPVVYSKEPISISNPSVKLYKENWLKGYKEIPKKEGGGWLNKYK